MKADMKNNQIKLEEVIIEKKKLMNEINMIKNENQKTVDELSIAKRELEKVSSIAKIAKCQLFIKKYIMNLLYYWMQAQKQLNETDIKLASQRNENKRLLNDLNVRNNEIKQKNCHDNTMIDLQNKVRQFYGQ